HTHTHTHTHTHCAAFPLWDESLMDFPIKGVLKPQSFIPRGARPPPGFCAGLWCVCVCVCEAGGSVLPLANGVVLCLFSTVAGSNTRSWLMSRKRNKKFSFSL